MADVATCFLNADDVGTFVGELNSCLGGDVGVISVVANALPKELAQMVHLAAKGDMKKAADLHYKLLPLMNAIFEEGNPTGIKALLEVSSKGEMPNALRLPLIKASKTLSNKIAALYNEL